MPHVNNYVSVVLFIVYCLHCCTKPNNICYNNLYGYLYKHKIPEVSTSRTAEAQWTPYSNLRVWAQLLMPFSLLSIIFSKEKIIDRFTYKFSYTSY